MVALCRMSRDIAGGRLRRFDIHPHIHGYPRAAEALPKRHLIIYRRIARINESHFAARGRYTKTLRKTEKKSNRDAEVAQEKLKYKNNLKTDKLKCITATIKTVVFPIKKKRCPTP